MVDIDAKSYLRQVKLYDTRINMKLEELAALEESILKITPTLKEDVVSSGGSQDKLGDAVVKMVDLKNEINAYIDKFVDAKRAVGDIIDRMDNADQFQVIHRRYVLYESFEQIACEMCMTYRNVCYIHGKALQAVSALLSADKTNNSSASCCADMSRAESS